VEVLRHSFLTSALEGSV